MNYTFLNWKLENELLCPMFRCADCGESINGARDEKGGLILWDGERVREGWYEGPSFAVHRGYCLDRFEAAHNKRFAWQDIGAFLADLLSDAGFELPAGVESIHDDLLGTLHVGMPKQKRRAEKTE